MISFIARNTFIRSALRSSGILGVLKGVSTRFAKSYEDRFAAALLAEVKAGDIVWDVGANIGYYTCKLAERTGPSGMVFAFEPVSSSFLRLKNTIEMKGLANVRLMQLALGHREESFSIVVTTDNDGVTNSLARSGCGKNTETITVGSGDRIIEGNSLPPDVVKIDVEAYEEEVIFGLRRFLQEGRCRSIFLEIHYQQLEQRGLLRAPTRIESFFKDCGYSVEWLDASHLRASNLRKI